ncbi:MAG: CDP-alcohol phosphatidyltransferase family protein, partial [Atopobiaceae bacterium]|nr:CDP-alcohol phosphatidyltransferase family protein [Atopobiaceae bacterium]
MIRHRVSCETREVHVTARDNIQPTDTSEWGRVKNATKSVTDYDAHAAQAHSVTVAPLGTPENPNSKIFTLANVITVCRFLLTVAFLWLFVNHANRYVALALYAIASLTDFLDGWVARSTQNVSWLGKIMDPIMDRVLLFTGVVGLVVRGELPLWVACFVILRDAYLLAGSMVLQRYRRRPVDVSIIGKVTTALLMVGFCFLL